MEHPFIREEMLLGTPALERLRHAHVMVFGIGGVGSYVCEALARAGVGHLTLVDHDTVSLSNINRQLIALHSTIGQPKAEVMAQRVQDINPDCQVRALVRLYNGETSATFFDQPVHYVADCIDMVSAKLHLIEACQEKGIPILSALGTGNKLSGTTFTVTDISKTSNCALARVMRKELRARGIDHLKVVFSPEEPRTPDNFGETPPPGRRSIPGSVSWVPSAAGLALAGAIIQDLISR